MSTSGSITITQPDAILVGAGIMSATLAVLLKELQPDLKVVIHERLGGAAQESSNGWNNAGTRITWPIQNGFSFSTKARSGPYRLAERLAYYNKPKLAICRRRSVLIQTHSYVCSPRGTAGTFDRHVSICGAASGSPRHTRLEIRQPWRSVDRTHTG